MIKERFVRAVGLVGIFVFLSTTGLYAGRRGDCGYQHRKGGHFHGHRHHRHHDRVVYIHTTEERSHPSHDHSSRCEHEPVRRSDGRGPTIRFLFQISDGFVLKDGKGI